jgi:hypothetical protein
MQQLDRGADVERPTPHAARQGPCLALRLAARAIIVVALSPGWLAPAASVRGLRGVIGGLRLADSDSFVSHDSSRDCW